MEYIAGRTDFELKNSAVTLGKFDGLHSGHQLLLQKITEQKKNGLNAVVFTFLYHPGNLLSDREMELIYTEDEKQCIIDQYGVDVMISYPFTEETRSMEPEHFIEEILVKKLDAKYIVVGSDFCFGKNRRGNTAMLAEYASKYNYKLEVITKKKNADEEISSSCIRKQISEGNMENVVKLLGRPFSVMGEVMHGRKIGRTIGFPTTNLMPDKSKLLPPDGVYVSLTTIDGKDYPGITNIGHNPTVGTTPEKRVETFLFDYDQELYGKFIQVSLLSRTRKEETFGSLEELKAQMDIDLADGRKYFSDLGLLKG
ncbi:bifunctional riboflavin kinase/FAD synthetase [Clostridium sp. KNHs205]|jgi:riboflavin kinase / FMN adenylyltransferase|uniref:bifunctional riboflavin kinase/FAD synthetase n=1 Tax=Clostridium sp. KNHs205 TaxID=1449050 RepID=UPI00051B72B5|nr:bifunctional riboflavin kinase/FAD synthetase [Clostridium sp. KNHs205]